MLNAKATLEESCSLLDYFSIANLATFVFAIQTT